MIIDAFLLVSDSQALTATAFSTNTLDLGVSTPQRDISVGESMGFGISVDVAADFTTTDETYTFEVVESANANLSSPTVIGVLVQTAAQLTIGALVFLPCGPVSKRYLGLRYTLAGTTPSITVTSWFGPRTMFSKAPVHYPNAYTP